MSPFILLESAPSSMLGNIIGQRCLFNLARFD